MPDHYFASFTPVPMSLLTPNSKPPRRWGTSSPVRYRPFRYPLPLGSAFGSGKSNIQKWQLLVRREGFEPPAFWSVGCLKAKSESFRLRFVLFAAVRSVDFPFFSVQPCPLFSDSGSKVGQKLSGGKLRCQSRQKNLPQIPKNEKAFAPHANVRCIILPRKKQAKTRVECRPGPFR